MKKGKPTVKKEAPSDFTDRAISVSNSKRILLLKAVGKIKVTKAPKEFSIPKLIDKPYVAQSLLKKIVRYYGNKFVLKATKFSKVEDKKAPGVTAISISL